MKKRAKAFTLIELLVVISIITMLMTLLLPALSRAKKQAQAVVCRARLRESGLGLSTATDARDGGFDPQSLVESDGFSSFGMNSFCREAPDVVLCPSASKPHSIRTYDSWGGPFMAYRYRGHTGSYGQNQRLARWHGSLEQFDVYAIKGAFRVPVGLDSMYAWAGHGYLSPPPPYHGAIERDSKNFVCINRHQGGVSALFLDWSVRKVGLKELWTLKWHPEFDTTGPWTKAGGVRPEDWPEWMRGFKDY